MTLNQKYSLSAVTNETNHDSNMFVILHTTFTESNKHQNKLAEKVLFECTQISTHKSIPTQCYAVYWRTQPV